MLSDVAESLAAPPPTAADTAAKIEYKNDVLTIRMDKVYEGWEQWFLLTGDVHWDNPHCVREKYKADLELARKRNAKIIDNGDFFCAMQSRNDRRGDKSSIRPEHNVANYFDALVDTATEYLYPYKDLFALIGSGNHESAIYKHAETDLTARLAKALGVNAGGYAGFIRFMFSRGASNKSSFVAFRIHGYGGGGVVNKGVQQATRNAVWVPDANMIIYSHIHEKWQLTLQRLRLSPGGNTFFDQQEHVQLATFKDEFSLKGGFHIEKGRPPKPIGGTWLRFYYDGNVRGSVAHEVISA